MRILVTGHTGFKGAWLVALLSRLGHEVCGLALDPEPGALFDIANFTEFMTNDRRGDIRDVATVRESFEQFKPELVMHLAAQPLVRRSYQEPRFTYETNVMGTFNILEAAQSSKSVRGLVMVTTDKVYRNVNRAEGYREDEPLGGDDPYSSSKAMADLLIQSWAKSFPGIPTAIVRGGNVIGGGDVSADRLLVDLISGFAKQKPVQIRYPEAVRPWQHVLDCLNGYLAVADALLRGRGEGAWNIGPDERSFVTVRSIADLASNMWGGAVGWQDVSGGEHPHEAGLLSLDATRARVELNWADRIPYPESLEWTIEWSRRVSSGEEPRAVTQNQINLFLDKVEAIPLSSERASFQA